MKLFKITSSNIRKNAAQAVMDIRGDDKLQVVIEPINNSKSNEQRGMFHALCKVFADETGYTPAQIKRIVKMELYGVEEVEVMGRRFEVLRSSEDLDRRGYSALIEQLYILAGEAGIVLV